MRFHGRDLALRPRHLEKAEAQESICLSNEGYTYPVEKNKKSHEFLQLLRHPLVPLPGADLARDMGVHKYTR